VPEQKPVVLSVWERDVLIGAAMAQVDRHSSPLSPLKPNPQAADRWREIADAIRMSTPVVYLPPKGERSRI
jgi:hypothetical protein